MQSQMRSGIRVFKKKFSTSYLTILSRSFRPAREHGEFLQKEIREEEEEGER